MASNSQKLSKPKLLNSEGGWQAVDIEDMSEVQLQNPEAAEVLDDVNPAHWIVPWNDLLGGRISSGAALCEIEELRSLCL